METQSITIKLNQKIPGVVLERPRFGRSQESSIWIEMAHLRAVADFLVSQPEWQFDWVENFSATQMDDVVILTYFLASKNLSERLILRGSVLLKSPDDVPEVPSLGAVWPSVAPFEREIAELFGIRFLGSDQAESERLKAELNWSGHPLRKSYSIEKAQFEFAGTRGGLS